MERKELVPFIIFNDTEEETRDVLEEGHVQVCDCDDFDPTNPSYGFSQMHDGNSTSSSCWIRLTPLQCAVKNGNKVAIKEELQKNRHSWRVYDNRGWSMLHLAFEYREPIKKPKFAHHRQRRRQTDNPRTRNQAAVKKFSAPQKGIIEVLEIFLDVGLDVNVKNNKGETPLWLAVKYRMNEVAEFLVARGADVTVRNTIGDTLAHMIVKNEIDSCCSKHRLSQEFTYVRRDNAGFWDWLLSRGVDVDCQNAFRETAYRLAIKKNLKNMSLILAKYTKEVNFTNSEGQNILHFFLDKNSEVDPYVYNYTNDIFKILLDKGVPVNAVDNRGRTPLHIAAKRRKGVILVHMLKHFTNVNACNELGDTVLHIAIDSFGFQSRSEEIIRTLISKGADIYMKNKSGMTPVQLAAKHKDERILRVLQEYHADFSVCTDEGDTLLHLLSRKKMELTSDFRMVDLLIKQGCNVNATNNHGFTPLHLAARTGCATVMKALIKHGADVNCKDTNHMTPLHLATLEDREEIIKELVSAGANVNSKNSVGKTALHLAAPHPSSLLKTLIKCGAHVDAKDYGGRQPLHCVLLKDNAEALDCLLASGANINDVGAPHEEPFLEFIRNKMIWNRVHEHLVTLRAAKLPITSLLKSYVDVTSAPMKKFFTDCLQEIEDMKKLQIHGNKSLYDLLLLDPYHRYNYVRSMRFKVLLISPCYFESNFRKYCGLIRTCYKESIERKPLLEPAKYAWYQLTKIGLPDICIERVLAYLNNSDLKTMIEGVDMEMEIEVFEETFRDNALLLHLL